jgi:DNA processing protein
MDSNRDPLIKIYLPEDLLGPLNPVERVNAPPELFVAGDVELLKRGLRVAVVGSRRASAEGLKRTSRLARFLVDRGFVVVSGLAEGIDTEAHRTTIDAGGFTIAVLGTPLERAYPRQNADLQHLIMERHLAVSQFPPGHPVTRTTFPRRNRTMALIAAASVIVEAGNSSGTLSQGWEALRLGRLLFIMKSTAEDPSLEWPREMLKYGAQVLSEPEEVLDFLPVEAGGPLASVAL